MREIKFRAWDKENEVMVYSDKSFPLSEYRFGIDLIYREGITLTKLSDRTNVTYEEGEEGFINDFEKVDAIIMQYTGAKDSNGNKIYENDIVKVEDYFGEDMIGKVIYDETEACYWLMKGDERNHFRMTFDLESYVHVIIGNIYENPGLLEEGTCKYGYSITRANINEIRMPENARSGIKEVKDIENSKREEYGKYKGYYKWDLTKAWFNMPNDAFYNKYGFNYHPHNDGNLYEECREFLSNNCVRMNNYVDTNEIAANIKKHLKRNGVKGQSIINQFKNKAGL